MKKTKIGEWAYINDPFVPNVEKKLHIDRYKFALQYIQSWWIVLDAGCGSGYGSRILSQKAGKVVGVDKYSDAINHAQKYHSKKNIEYHIVDLTQPLNFQNEYFNAIIAFEVIEHIQNQEGLLNEFKRILKPDGVLIISTPNWDVRKKVKIQNPYHIKELTKEEFVKLVAQFFKIEKLFGHGKYLPLKQLWLKRYARYLVIDIIIDFLKLRKMMPKKIINWLATQFAEVVYTPIQVIDMNSHSKYRNLIIVAKKYENRSYADLY